MKMELEDVTYGLLSRLSQEMSHADTERFSILLFKFICHENLVEALRIWTEKGCLMHLKPGLVMKKFVRKLWVPEMERRFLKHAPWIHIVKTVWENTLPVIGFYFLQENVQEQMRPLLHTLKHKESNVRRDAAKCIALLCQYAPGNIIVSVFSEIHQEVMGVCIMQRRLVRGSGNTESAPRSDKDSDSPSSNLYPSHSPHESSASPLVYIETLLCTDWSCLEGCIYAYIHLLHTLEAVSHRKSKASIVHHSEFHLITSIVLDVLSMSLDFVDHRNILSPSLELLSRLLSQYSDYCSQWRRQKVLNILEKLVSILNQNRILVSVQAVVLEILGKLADMFLEPVLTILNDHHYDVFHFVSLLEHQDYLIRANTAVLISVVISASIELDIDISKHFFLRLRENRYVKLQIEPFAVDDDSPSQTKSNPPPSTRSPTLPFELRISAVRSHRVTFEEANHFVSKSHFPHTQLTNLYFDSNYSALRFLLFKLFDSFRCEQSSLALKHFCTAFSHCLPACLHVRELKQHVTPILYSVLQVDASFWAVSYELLNMVSNFDYFVLEYYERRRGSEVSISELIFENIIWKYLLDANEKVREKACEVLIYALPQLHLDSAKMTATDHVKQSHEFESDLLKRIISTQTNEHDHNIRVYTSQEISSIVFILEYILTCMGSLSHSHKDSLCGILLLLDALSKEYSSYEESSPYLVNYNKGLGAAGEPIYSEYSIELLNNLLNIAKYSSLTSDLKFFSLLMSCMSVHILHFDYKHDSTELISRTLTEYVLLILDMFQAAKEENAPSLSELLQRYKSLSVSETAMDQLYSSIRRSSNSATVNLHFRAVRENTLQALYFLCMFGEQSTVLSYSDEIIDHMNNHYTECKEKAILCVQELFASLFDRKSNYFRFFVSIDQVPVIVNSSQRGMFQNFFFLVRDRDIRKMRANRSHSSLVAPPQVTKSTPTTPGSAKSSNKSGSTTPITHGHSANMAHVLEQFQPLVLRIKHTFKHTHNKDLQTIILFMLSRMVCIGVNFRRLDKDHSFLQHILRLIRDMDVSENTQLLYYINDFVSLLLFMVKFQPKELTEDVLLPTIISGLSNTTWSTALLLQRFTPLLVRSFQYKIKDPESKTAISNDYGERLLQLFLTHLSFSECMVSLHKLMNKLPKSSLLTARVSDRIVETLILELRLKVEVNELSLCEEIDKIFAFLDSLIYHSIPSDLCEDLMQILLEILSNFTQLDKTAVDTHESVRCLLAIRMLNLLPIKSNKYNGKFLACSLFCMRVAETSCSYRAEDEGISMVASRILVEILVHLENGESLCNLVSDPAGQLLEVLMKHLSRDILHANKKFHNHIRFDGMGFTTGISILMRSATFDATFLPLFCDFCVELIQKLSERSFDEHHVGKIQKHTLILALLFVMDQVTEEHVGTQEIVSPHPSWEKVLNLPDFWQFLCFHTREQLCQVYFQMFCRDVNHITHNSFGLADFVRRTIHSDSSLSQLRQVLRLLENVGARPEHVPQDVREYLEEYRDSQTPLRVRDRMLDKVLGPRSETRTHDTSALMERLKQVRERINKIVEVKPTSSHVTDISILFAHPERFPRLPQMIARLSPHHLATFLRSRQWKTDELRLLVDATQEITNQPTMDEMLLWLNEQIEEESRHLVRLQILGECIRSFFNNAVGSKHEEKLFEMHARFFITLSEIVHGAHVLESDKSGETTGTDQSKLPLHQPLADALPPQFDSVFVFFFLNFTQDFLKHWIRLTLKDESQEEGSNFQHKDATLEACKTFLQCTHGDVIESFSEPLPLIQTIVKRLFLIPESQTITVSDTIPFVRSDHRALLERIGIYILRISREDAYSIFFQSDGARQDYRHMDTLQVTQLMRLFFSISSGKNTFHKLWGFTFDMFKRVSDMPSADEMQLATLKLMTMLLGRVRFASSVSRETTSVDDLQSDDAFSQTYSQLMKSTFKYFDPFYSPVVDLSTTLIEQQLLNMSIAFEQSTPIHQDALDVVVDDIYFQAIIDVFLRFLAGTSMKNHQEINPQFFLEMTKSLAFLMLNNPNLFAVLSSSQKNASISRVPSSSQSAHIADVSETVLGFDQAFYHFAKLYQNKLYQDDWMLKQYMMLIMLKSSKYIPQDERLKYQNLLMKVLQENLVRKNTRLCGYFGLWILIQHRDHNLVTKMLTYVAQNMSKWFDESRETLELLMLLECFSALVQNFPVEASMHNISKKYIHSLFELSNDHSISLTVLKAIYKKLNMLLENYSLAHDERHMIEKAAVVHNEGQQAWKVTPSEKSTTTSATSTAASYLMPWRRSVTPPSTGTPKAAPAKKRGWFGRSKSSTILTVPDTLSDSSSIKTTSSKMTSAKHIESLRQYLLPRISHTQAHRVLKYCLMMTSMYTGESSREGEHSLNILEIFQHFRADQTSRESELIIRFIPQILRNFVDATTNLSLFMSEFLSDHGNARILALILNAYFEQFVEDVGTSGEEEATTGDTSSSKSSPQRKHDDSTIPHKTLDVHTSLALRTLSMKRPVPMALWALQCLFASCLRLNAYFPHLLDIGVSMEREETDLSTEFIFDFAYMALLFKRFLEKHHLKESKKAFQQSLSELAEESVVGRMIAEL